MWGVKVKRDIIEVLDQIRTDRGLTMDQLEKESGLSAGHFSKLLRRRSENVGLTTINALAAALGMELHLRPAGEQ